MPTDSGHRPRLIRPSYRFGTPAAHSATPLPRRVPAFFSSPLRSIVTDPFPQAVAAHHAAYRPSLHDRILAPVLDDRGPFDVGLDVGCGTGRSAVALAAHCTRVQGVDPSPAMLAQATAHDRITYREGNAEALPLPARSVDVVTYAGVLPTSTGPPRLMSSGGYAGPERSSSRMTSNSTSRTYWRPWTSTCRRRPRTTTTPRPFRVWTASRSAPSAATPLTSR